MAKMRTFAPKYTRARAHVYVKCMPIREPSRINKHQNVRTSRQN